MKKSTKDTGTEKKTFTKYQKTIEIRKYEELPNLLKFIIEKEVRLLNVKINNSLELAPFTALHFENEHLVFSKNGLNIARIKYDYKEGNVNSMYNNGEKFIYYINAIGGNISLYMKSEREQHFVDWLVENKKATQTNG